MRITLFLMILGLLTLTGISGCSTEKGSQKNLNTPQNSIEKNSANETQIRANAFEWLNRNYKGMILNGEYKST